MTRSVIRITRPAIIVPVKIVTRIRRNFTVAASTGAG
jgi:hypothetical protein